MDSHAPTGYSEMSQDNDGTPIYSQFSQSPFTPPPYAHSTFPIAPFGSSPFAFRPFQPLQPTPQHVARRSPMPNQPQGEVMSAFTDGVSKPDGTLEQSRATKLPARRRIEEVNIDGGQSASQKGVRLKRRKKDQSNSADLDDNKEKKSRESWKDAWVVQLIHIRGARHGEFGRPPKQGVDLWSKVATELASLFPECDKDGQACRKKWGRVYDSYKRDKAHNSISGNDRRVTCEWYEIVDEYMHSRANVVSESHASAIGGKDGMEKQNFIVPTPTDEVGIEEGCEDGSFSATKQKSTPIARDQRHRKDRGIEDALFDMANTAKIMASQQQERDADRKADASERRQLLSSLTCAISGLMEVMKTFKKE